ncbi:S1 family peptidase [Streptosporangium sp. 'caverna']|uniref:S1 family peptidase n=1 Tax=Streptosporangium sp. 'caverna' TaxID=2202249 RepID=UPI000D7E62E4|nr:S1 family peptidase [Streptosporangium sp. 'caverna']AWS43366.1 serine protease [Streptosporangium sp. 'caverna']
MFCKHAVIVGCALAIITFTGAAVPVAAQPQRAATPSALSALSALSARKPPPGMLKALQRDLHLSAEQAQVRLLNEIHLTPIEAQLRRRLDTRFAGSWLSGPTAQTLVVATTTAADATQITDLGARAEIVRRSLMDLQAIKKKIDDAFARHPYAGSVRYIDTTTNKVVVLAEESATAVALIKAIAVDRAAVKIVSSTERPQTMHDLVGGQSYSIGAIGRCSTGFSVIGKTTKGFLSAGHCGKAGSITTGANRVPQGVVHASTFPGSDFSYITTNSLWTPTPNTDNGAGSMVSIAGSRQAIKGASVCRSGATTGWRCGTIQQFNASVTYPQGSVSGLTRTDVCAESGDSGGPFISIDQAQGITSGASGNCAVGGFTYFQPVNEILTTYDLSLVTTASTPPLISTGTCTGYPDTATGTLRNGRSAYHPTRANTAGVHLSCLQAEEGTDFDLYLEKRTDSDWVTVATADSPNPSESIRYTGAPGQYRYRIVAESGSGAYLLGCTAP